MAARRSPGLLAAAAAALGCAPAVARDVALKDQVAVFCAGCRLATIERIEPGSHSPTALDASGRRKVDLRHGDELSAIAWAVITVGRDDSDTLVIKDLAGRTEGGDASQWDVPLVPAFWGASFRVLGGDARFEARRPEVALGRRMADTFLWAVRVEEHIRDAWRTFAPSAEAIVSDAAAAMRKCRSTKCEAAADRSTEGLLKKAWRETCSFFSHTSRLYVLVFGHGFAQRANHDVQYRWSTEDGLDTWRPSVGNPRGGDGGWWAGTSMDNSRGRGTLRVKVDGVEFSRTVDMTGDGGARCVGGGEESSSAGHGHVFVAAFGGKLQFDTFRHAVEKDSGSNWFPERARTTGGEAIRRGWDHQALVDLCRENVDKLPAIKLANGAGNDVSGGSESAGDGSLSVQVTEPAADSNDERILLIVGMASGCLLVCTVILVCLWRRRPAVDLSLADDDTSQLVPNILGTSWNCEVAGGGQWTQPKVPASTPRGYYQQDLSLGSVLAALLGEGALGSGPLAGRLSCLSTGERARDLDLPDAETY